MPRQRFPASSFHAGHPRPSPRPCGLPRSSRHRLLARCGEGRGEGRWRTGADRHLRRLERLTHLEANLKPVAKLSWFVQDSEPNSCAAVASDREEFLKQQCISLADQNCRYGKAVARFLIILPTRYWVSNRIGTPSDISRSRRRCPLPPRSIRDRRTSPSLSCFSTDLSKNLATEFDADRR